MNRASNLPKPEVSAPGTAQSRLPDSTLGLALTGLLALGACAARETPPDAPPVTVAALPAPPAETAAPSSSASVRPAASAAPTPAVKRTLVTVDGAKLSFELPNDAWHPHPGLGPPPPGVTQTGFERDDVLDAQGNAVRPYCGVTTEPVLPADRDIVAYSLSWRLRVPFKVDSVFTHEEGTIQTKNAIGYRGHTSYGGDEHSLFVVHGLHGDHGFVFVCDTTTSVLPKVEGEILELLKSLRHTDGP